MNQKAYVLIQLAFVSTVLNYTGFQVYLFNNRTSKSKNL